MPVLWQYAVHCGLGLAFNGWMLAVGVGERVCASTGEHVYLIGSGAMGCFLILCVLLGAWKGGEAALTPTKEYESAMLRYLSYLVNLASLGNLMFVALGNYWTWTATRQEWSCLAHTTSIVTIALWDLILGGSILFSLVTSCVNSCYTVSQ